MSTLSLRGVAAWLLARDAPVVDGTLDLADSGVKRPSSTWTYLVHDSPFDSGFEDTVRNVRSLLRRKKD